MNRKTILIGFTFSLMMFALGACGASEEMPLEQISQGESVEFTTIRQDTPLGDGPEDPAYLALTGSNQLDAAQGQIPKAALEQAQDRVAGENELILVVYAGRKSSSGYSIQIDQVAWQGDRMTVVVSEEAPDEEDVVEPALTMPYHLVKVDGKEMDFSGTWQVRFENQQGEILKETTIKP